MNETESSGTAGHGNCAKEGKPMTFFQFLRQHIAWLNADDSATPAIPDEFIEQERKFVPVKKWSHARRSGTDIFCPSCSEKTRVYNFGWSTLLCNSCLKMVGKYSWLRPVQYGADQQD